MDAEWSRKAVVNGEDGWELGVWMDYFLVATLDMGLSFFQFLISLLILNMLLHSGLYYIVLLAVILACAGSG